MAVTGALVGVGTATGAIGGGGVVRACVNSTSGAPRLVDSQATSCRTGEQMVSWNQVGPQGAPGEAGPAGPQGPAGPAGGGGKLFLQTVSGVSLANFAFKDVIKKAVPAGTYLIEVTMAASDMDIERSADDYVNCWLVTGATGYEDVIFNADFSVPGELAEGNTASMRGVRTFGASTEIRVMCRTRGAVGLRHVILTASATDEVL